MKMNTRTIKERIFVVESKESNQGLLDALADIDMKEDDKYYIAYSKSLCIHCKKMHAEGFF